jgi:hypothetical protein
MSPTQKVVLKDLLLTVGGVLLAILSYLAVEVRADVRDAMHRNAVQDSTLGIIVNDLRYIKQGVDDLRRRP